MCCQSRILRGKCRRQTVGRRLTYYDKSKKKKAVYKIRNKKHSFFFPQENPRKSSESSLIPSLQLPPQQPQFPAQKRREKKEGCDWLISTIDSIRLANRGVKAT